MQNKKNSIQIGVNEHNQKKGGWWCSQKPPAIFINVVIYRDISVQTSQFLTIFGL